MNSKAIRKQLLAAVAMVLVAAVALGSSTYAWFVASGNVTAEGMSVKAQSEAGLVIRYKGGTNQKWGTTAAGEKTTEEARALNPASTADGKKWYHANAEYADAYGAIQDTRDEVLTGFENYYLLEEFQIRSAIIGKEVTGLYVPSVTVTGQSNKPLSTALRVGIALNKSDNESLGLGEDFTDAFVVFAPVKLDEKNKPTYEYKVYKGKTDQTGTDVTALEADAGTKDNAALAGSGIKIPSAEDNCVNVKIYIWYEGEDRALFTDNYASEALNISVNFTSMGVYTAPVGP